MWKDPMRIGWTGLAAMAVLAGPTLLAQESSDARSPALAGRWKLNEKESEDPKAKFVMRRPGEPEPEERAAGARRPREDPRRRGRPAAALPPLEAPPGLGVFLDAPKTLTIGGSDAELSFDDGRGAALSLPTDRSGQKLGEVTRTARWEGSSLIVEATNSAGARLTTRYNLMLGQRKLEVYMRLSDQDGNAVTLRRVYDPAEAAP